MARYALCIGINDYPGTGSDLSGCVNDAHDWSTALSERGYAVRQLINQEATKRAMVEGIRRLVEEAEKGDRLALVFSGHGSWTIDASGDESDGRDEALCPYDFTEEGGGLITDDELFDIFAPLKPDVHMVFISDSCNSGTITDFAPRAARVAEGFPRAKFMPPANFMSAEELKIAKVIAKVKVTGKPRLFNGIYIGGCQDDESSKDAMIDGRFNGAFSHFALKALRQIGDDSTYKDWFKEIRKFLPSQDFPQTPSFNATKAQKRWKLFT